MKRDEIEALRVRVSCEAVLENAGYVMDPRESTRRAVKYRQGTNIFIVTHQGLGWFDPLSDRKGDIFALTMLLEDTHFTKAAETVASLIGYRLTRRAWSVPQSLKPNSGIATRWRERSAPFRGSGTWSYLCRTRMIPATVVEKAIGQSVLREGPFGSMWAAHRDNSGVVVGWEERGPDWRGFSTGGNKVLFRLGRSEAVRLCVTEAAIDAMSLAALEGLRAGSLYVSTGGGWSPKTEAALVELLARPNAELVCATDANAQGDAFARRLQAVAAGVGRPAMRLRPTANDWNEVLQKRTREIAKMENEKRRAASRLPASREAAPG